MKISSRHILKSAGPKEAKKADGLNFDHVTKTLSDGGSKQVSKEEILSAKLTESNLLISSDKIEQIRSLELVPDARKRVNDIETALIIIGAVLNSNSKEEAKSAVELFDWYLQYKELSPGSFGIDNSITQDAEKIILTFKELFDKVRKVKEESDATSKQSGGKEYISNEVVYNFGDGWKVVYVPATGEIESFPGLPGTSHDRILEGNKNGLCLGRSQRLYQDNGDGKIFSVRDPENNPRVTIRIFGSSLEEAKGKNNNPPDVDGAIHAKEWFESLDQLSYKDSYDFKRFPPTDMEMVINAIKSNPASPFKNGWAPHWYGKGIQVLDEDIEKKFTDLDPAIIAAGFGKYPKFFEKTKPVVIHWCKKYVNEGSKEAEITLFGTEYRPPTHEVYKTYRKEEFMKRAAEKLSKEEPDRYFKIGLQEYPEYEIFSDHPIRTYAENNRKDFLENFSEKPWAKPYVGDVAKAYAERSPINFLENFSEKPWAEPYINDAVKAFAERDPHGFLYRFSEKPWAEPYRNDVAKTYAEQEPRYFLYSFSEKPWAKPYRNDAARASAELSPINFLDHFSEKPWAEPYRNDAARASAERDPHGFLYNFSERPWAKEARPELNEKSYLDIAAKACAEQNPYYFLKNFSEKEWAELHIDVAAKAYAKLNPKDFLSRFSEKPWAKLYILKSAAKSYAEQNPREFLLNFNEKPWQKPYLSIAANALIEQNAHDFLRYCSKMPWAKPYINSAAKVYAQKNPTDFLYHFSEKEWAKEERPELEGKSYVDITAKASAEQDPTNFLYYFPTRKWAKEKRSELDGKSYIDIANEALSAKGLNQTASQVNVKLLKLAGAIKKISTGNISQEIVELKKLASKI